MSDDNEKLIPFAADEEEACLSVLSLRDYFAGCALLTFAPAEPAEAVARRCYEFADAMLAARAERKEGQ